MIFDVFSNHVSRLSLSTMFAVALVIVGHGDGGAKMNSFLTVGGYDGPDKLVTGASIAVILK